MKLYCYGIKFIFGLIFISINPNSFAENSSIYNHKSANQFDSIIIFGDSLSDQGGELGRRDKFIAGGYNNLNYVEIITPILTGKPSISSFHGGNNYAQSNARTTRTDRNSQNQINRYLTKVGGRLNPNNLHIINIGGNDLSDTETIRQIPFYIISLILDQPFSLTNNSDPDTIVNQANLLSSQGAKHIMVTNLWNPSYFPLSYQIPIRIITALGGRVSEEASTILRFIAGFSFDLVQRNSIPDIGGVQFYQKEILTLLYSQLLLIPRSLTESLFNLISDFSVAYSTEYFRIVKIGLENSTANVLFADTFKLYDEIYADPQKFGIDNVLLTECNIGLSASSNLCDLPIFQYQNKTYLWSDWLHPSPTAHKILAEYFLSLINAPNYVASIYHQIDNLINTTQQFISAQLNNNRLNPQVKLNQYGFFLGLSGSKNKQNSYLNNNHSSTAVLHIAPYYRINQQHLLGIAYSISQKQTQPFAQFSFKYQFHDITLFHQYTNHQFWLNSQIFIGRAKIKNIQRKISLGKLNRIESANNTSAYHFGINTTWGYEFFQQNNVAMGAFLKLNYHYFKIKGFSEEEYNSTSMRFAAISQKNPHGGIGIYADFQAAKDDSWNIHTAIALDKTIKRPLEISTNIKSFSRNYNAKINQAADYWLNLSTGINLKPTKKTKLNLTLNYQRGQNKNSNLSYNAGFQYQF